MHNSIFIVLLCAFFHCGESSQPVSHFDMKEAQTKMLRRALNRVAAKFVRGGMAANEEVCTWKGIDCTDGLVTALCLHIPRAVDDASILVEWLPPTLEFMHVTCTRIENEDSFRSLPRELRYLCWILCDDETEYIDFSYLPLKMEELILVDSNLSKEIRLEKMPQTMRFVHIQQSPWLTETIIINYVTLPASLKEVRMTCMFTGSTIEHKVTAIGDPGDFHLQTEYDERYPKEGSQYYESFERRQLEG